MRLAHIACRNIKGFDGDFERDFGQVNLILGKNATNKTSCLSLITGLFGPANPRMLRTGADSGHIESILEDGNETWTFRRDFLPGEVKSPTAKSSRTGRIGAPAAWLKQILDVVSLDIIKEAMNAKEDRQAQILLEVMPLELEPGVLKEAVKGCPEFAKEAEEAQAKLPALDAIAHLAQPNKGKIYLARRDANRDAKKARTLAQQFRESLPKEADGTDWSGVAEGLLKQLESVAAKEAREREAAEREFSDKRESFMRHFSALTEKIDDEIDTKIQLLKDELAAKVEALNRARSSRQSDLVAQERIEKQKLNDGRQAELDRISESIRPERERLAGEHATANERAGREAADARTKANAEQNERETAELESKSEAMTAALKNLDGVRDKLLEKLPIPGLKFEPGPIPYLHGVPLSEVNTQQRGMFWLKVAIMRAGELGLVVADGCECFDPDNFKGLVDAAKTVPDVQFFFGRVDGEPFRIETV